MYCDGNGTYYRWNGMRDKGQGIIWAIVYRLWRMAGECVNGHEDYLLSGFDALVYIFKRTFELVDVESGGK